MSIDTNPISPRDRAESILENILGSVIISRQDLDGCMRGDVNVRERVILFIERQITLYAVEFHKTERAREGMEKK